MYLDDRGLTEEQRMMRDACRLFVNEHLIPFIRQDWQREWLMTPEDRLPRKILKVADQIGIRTLGVPEEFGGTPIDPKTEVRNFAVIAPRHLQQYWFPKIVADPTFLYMDGTVDITRFKIVKAMFPDTAGAYAGPEK